MLVQRDMVGRKLDSSVSGSEENLQKEQMNEVPAKKRKETPEKMDQLFPIFQTPTKSPQMCKTPSTGGRTGSPSKSPLKKKATLVIRQGSAQSNKIFRYLQPKRLIDTSNCETADPANEEVCTNVNPVVTQPKITGKENAHAAMELKVVLTRLDNSAKIDHTYCLRHKSPMKLCCDSTGTGIAGSENVVHAIDHIMYAHQCNPSLRLGVARPKCASSIGACTATHNEVTAEDTSATIHSLYSTMMQSNLGTMMVKACLQKISPRSYPSARIVRNVFSVMEVTAETQVLMLAKSLIRRLVAFHSPCSPGMRRYYISVLHNPDAEVKTSSQIWSLLQCDYFEKTISDVELLVESLLSSSQKSNRIPGKREVHKPKRYRNSPSPRKTITRRRSSHAQASVSRQLDLCDAENKDAIEDDLEIVSRVAKQKRIEAELALKSMSPEKKALHVFTRLEVLVDILEKDLITWLVKNGASNNKIWNRVDCPLVVIALWKPSSDTGFDSPNCRKIFSLYASAWVAGVQASHIKVLARLIGLIAEVSAASEPQFYKEYPNIGERCENTARKLCDVLKNPDVETHRLDAVAALHPPWLRMLVAANLLGVPPTIASVSAPKLSGDRAKQDLWPILLEAALNTYHVKEAMDLLTQASEEADFTENNEMSSNVDGRHCSINYNLVFCEIMAFYHLRRELNGKGPYFHLAHLLNGEST